MKLPVVDEMERVMDATTLPTLLLGEIRRSRRKKRTQSGTLHFNCRPCAD